MTDDRDSTPTNDSTAGDDLDVRSTSTPSNYKVRRKRSGAGDTGVFGYSTSGSGAGRGVFGQVDSPADAAAGIRGEATDATTDAAADGVVGVTNGPGDPPDFAGDFSATATGVRGIATSPTGQYTAGVYGRNDSTTDGAFGVEGRAAASGNVVGVFGSTTSATTGAAGVRGRNFSGSGTVYGVEGVSSSVDLGAAGVRGEGKSDGAYGVLATTDATVAPALYASGNGGGAIEAAGPVGINQTPTSFAALSVSANNDFVGTFDNVGMSDSSGILELNTFADNCTYTGWFVKCTGGAGTMGGLKGDGNGGVTMSSQSCDVAEWFRTADSGAGFEPGQVVGFSGGELTEDTDGADAALVVSDTPMVSGNTPDENDRDRYERVALLGQVDVAVSEPVDAGDLLVADGDGGARPVEDSAPSSDDDTLVVGRAMRTVSRADLTTDATVRTFVGGPSGDGHLPASGDDPEVVDALEDRIDELRRENDRLRTTLERKDERIADLEAAIESLGERLTGLAERVDGLEAGDLTPFPADD